MPDVKKCIGLYKFEKRYKERFANIIQPFIEMLTPLHYEDAQKKLVTRSLKVDQIDSMIKSGSFLVFDLSRPSPNVMYELGIGNALNKPKVLLISRQGFKQNWGAKKPFDLEGRELLIYESERDLIEKLHKSFWDAYYANSEDVKINWKTPLLVNSRQSKINIGKIKEVWCDESINGDCLVTFTAKIQSSSSKNPDLRLNIAGSQGSFPRITIIFPWENSENEKDQFECHFDFIKDPGTAIRIREESVCKNNIKEFTGYLYISKQKICFWANVFPDDLFGVYVEKETLDQKFNYKFPDSYFIGFSSTENTRGEISGLSIKKLSDPLLDNQILDEKDFIKPTATSSEHKNNLIASILHELKQFQSFL